MFSLCYVSLSLSLTLTLSLSLCLYLSLSLSIASNTGAVLERGMSVYLSPNSGKVDDVAIEVGSVLEIKTALYIR